MNKEEVLGMIKAARLNAEKLEACTKHKFVIGGLLQQHAVCSNCNGRMPTERVYAYARGYAHAGGKRSDVHMEVF